MSTRTAGAQLSRAEELRLRMERSKAIYEYIEREMQQSTGRETESLSDILLTAGAEQIEAGLYSALSNAAAKAPAFPGKSSIGSVRYLLYWLLREGGQRLDGEIRSFKKASAIDDRKTADARFLARLIEQERERYGDFSWTAIEGTVRERHKRGLDAKGGIRFQDIVRGHVKEVLEGLPEEEMAYDVLELEEKSRRIQGSFGEMDYDVVIDLRDRASGERLEVLLPCKGRGTTGGGHSSIFTRDVMLSALNVKMNIDNPPYIVPLVVAESWRREERDFLEENFCDGIVYVRSNQRTVVENGKLPEETIDELREVFLALLSGELPRFALSLSRYML